MMMITNFENSFLIGMNFRHEKALIIKKQKYMLFLNKVKKSPRLKLLL